MFEQQQFDFFDAPVVSEDRVGKLHYQLLRKKRKSLSLYVLADQTVQVRAPLKMSSKVIDAFVEKHQAWIEKRKNEVAKHTYMFNPVLENDTMIPIFGKKYALKMIDAASTQINLSADHLLFKCSSRIKRENRSAYFNKALIQFAEPLFKRHYRQCFEHFQNYYAIPSPELAMKHMKSQWGNYSKRQHRVTLNAKLIHTPEICLQNVIFHELCHTRYHGHGKRFYQLLSQVMPNWQDAEKKLKHLT